MSAARPARAQRRAERTTEIVDIAARLFAERGYAETGVAELCAAVGLGRGALYHYIDSKESLVSAIHQRVADALVPAGGAIVEQDVAATEKLRLFGLLSIRTIVDYPDHVVVFMRDYKALTGKARQRLKAQRETYEAQLAAILEQGRREESFAFDDLDLTMLAWFGIHNATYESVRVRPAEDVEAIAAAFYRVFTRGIAAPGR